jgi:hypothetical protein
VLSKLRSSTETFFRRVAKSPSHLNGWTVWKDHKKALRGEGFSRNSSTPGKAFGFITPTPRPPTITVEWLLSPTSATPITIRSSRRIRGHGCPVYEDLYALSQMVQWMWRSRIRSLEPINVFIPSSRMRALFERWLEAASTVELVKEIDPSNPYF